MWKTKIRTVKIEDLYRTLTLSITFDNFKDYENFEFDLIFDIQATLEGSYAINIYNRHTEDRENRYLLLKSLPMKEALQVLEVLIADERYVAIQIYDFKYIHKCQECSEYHKDVDTFKLNGSEVAKLRTMREKLLEICSYSS